MAYLGLGVDAPFKPLAEVRPIAPSGLSAEERRLVHALCGPAGRGLPRSRNCPRIVQDLVWVDPPRDPAAVRHDALRRYAAACRATHGRLRHREADAIRAGLTQVELAEIRAIVGAPGARRRSRTGTVLVYGLLITDILLGVACAIEWLSPRVGSLAIAFVLAAVLLISFAPLLAEPDPARRRR